MLLLGFVGAQLDAALLSPEWILPGSLAIAVAGFALAWAQKASLRRRHFIVRTIRI